MGQMPTLRRCITALALLVLLYATLFIGAEQPTAFRAVAVAMAFFVTFPADQMLRLWHLMRDHRPPAKDFLFAAAIDPAEGHFEPNDYTLIGVITDVVDLDPGTSGQER